MNEQQAAALGGSGGVVAPNGNASAPAAQDAPAATTAAAAEGGNGALQQVTAASALRELEAAELEAAAEHEAAEAEAELEATTKITPALPLALVFDTLLEQKILEAVDVCELGCVCTELSSCVRDSWDKAAAVPGSQRRMLACADDDAGGRLDGFAPSKFGLFRRGRPITTLAMAREQCSCCGDKSSYAYPFPFSRAGWDGYEQPDSVSYEPAFTDWMGPVLCRPCYDAAQKSRAPHHSVAARFALKEWDTLVRKYNTPLPRSILECAVQVLSVPWQVRPLFEFSSLHDCMVRAANFALTVKTPSELQARWSRPRPR